MASDFRAHALEQRRLLLAQLVPSVHRSSLRRIGGPDSLIDVVSDQIGKHDFTHVNTNKVAQHLANVCRLLSSDSQETKATVLQDMVNNQYVSTQRNLVLAFSVWCSTTGTVQAGATGSQR